MQESGGVITSFYQVLVTDTPFSCIFVPNRVIARSVVTMRRISALEGSGEPWAQSRLQGLPLDWTERLRQGPGHSSRREVQQGRVTES